LKLLGVSPASCIKAGGVIDRRSGRLVDITMVRTL
jgi:hypothetical protein